MNNTGKFVPIIGKNVIENLTQGMYDDARFVYREYVQNAADQIDIATKQGLYKSGEQPSIIIQIDKGEKKIEVIDDATGIKQSDVLPLLGNIAQSTKNKYEDKGFRGIGRLGGLGYCEKLTFETSFFGENVKSTMVWDAKRLKEIFNDGNIQIGAAELISMTIEYSYSQEKESEHYFKVTMENVTNEILLDVQKVKEYLSMVAPVPFANTFTFKKQIYENAADKGVQIDEYNVYVNTDPLYKSYKDAILNDKGSDKDEIKDIVFFEEEFNNQSLFWGWYGITENMYEIPEINKEKGIRLRKSNIQIGLENRLNEFFKQPRGNEYFIGEVYAINKELIPNGRRDFFLDNEECSQFTTKLRELFLKLYKLYQDFAEKKSAQKTVTEYKELTVKIEDKTIDNSQKEELKSKLEKLETKTEKAIKKLDTLKKRYDGQVLGNIIEKMVIETPKQKTNDVVTIPTQSKTNVSKPTVTIQEENILKKVYTILRSNLIKSTAEELIQKIEEKFKR